MMVFFQKRLGKNLIWQNFSETWESDFKFITFIIYFILILLLLLLLKTWRFKIKKIQKKRVQKQKKKSKQKEKQTKIKHSYHMIDYRTSPPKVFLGNGVLKICSKLTGKHPCGSLISIKLQRYWIHTSACVFSYNFAEYLHSTFI